MRRKNGVRSITKNSYSCVANNRTIAPTIVRWVQLIVLSDFSLTVRTCFVSGNERHSPAIMLRGDLLAMLRDKARSEILIRVVLS